MRISRRRRDWAAKTIRRALLDRKPGATIAVWGLAYKENTHSIKNSASLATIAQLNGAQIRVHDPAVTAELIARQNVTGFDDPLRAVQGADALMILTPWPQYRQVTPLEIAQALSGKIVIDPYAVLDPAGAAKAGFAYFTLGRAAIAAS